MYLQRRIYSSVLCVTRLADIELRERSGKTSSLLRPADRQVDSPGR